MNKLIKIYRSLPRHNNNHPSAVTIGNFDGVHIGHQQLIKKVVQTSNKYNLVPTVLSFNPHPKAYFAMKSKTSNQAPRQISSLRDKIQALTKYGIRQVVLLPFNHHLAHMPANIFVQQLLVSGLNTKELFVGRDFKFGHKREGDIQLLEKLSTSMSFGLNVTDDIISSDGLRVSSSYIRTSLSSGNIELANSMLGRPYQLSGHVLHGRKLGRTIGVPTLNIKAPEKCALRLGVYTVMVYGLNNSPIPGVASIGVRPTVEKQGNMLLEVHLLNTNVQAYGKLVCVEFLSFIREELKFPNLTTMKAAIEQDMRQANDYFVTHGLQ